MTTKDLRASPAASPDPSGQPGPPAPATGWSHSRVFLVDSDVTASISGLTITGGDDGGDGGGVLNDGMLTLTNCTLKANSAYNGGGLANYAQ